MKRFSWNKSELMTIPAGRPARAPTVELNGEYARDATGRRARRGYHDVVVHCGNGFEGWPAEAPYDAIVVTAAPESVPTALLNQLAPGGRLVIPVGKRSQMLQQWVREGERGFESRNLIPVVLLIGAVLGSIYSGVATATEAAAVGVVGSLLLSAAQGSLKWATFRDSLLGATRLYCMIALILAGAAFLTLAMGYIGLPRHLAEFIGGLGLSQLGLLLWLMVFYIVLGCFLDGISMVVLTMGVILPTIQKAGIDLVWFGIFIVLVVEMAQITPPVGFNLFVLQGMTRRDIGWVFTRKRGVVPCIFKVAFSAFCFHRKSRFFTCAFN